MKTLEFMDEGELRELMTALARGIEIVAEKMGCEKPLFALVLFNDPAVAQYICNCQRTEMIQAMRETADRLERKQDISRVQFPRD